MTYEVLKRRVESESWYTDNGKQLTCHGDDHDLNKSQLRVMIRLLCEEIDTLKERITTLSKS